MRKLSFAGFIVAVLLLARGAGPDALVAQVLGAHAQLQDVNFDWMEPSRKVRISIDQDQARLLGFSSRALAEALNGVVTGTTITQVRDNIYLIDVIARAQDEQRV